MSSSPNNSWTILSPEENAAAAAAAETLRPLTEETAPQDEPNALTEGDGGQALSEEHQTAEATITKPCEEAGGGACPVPTAPLEDPPSPAPDARTEDAPVDAGLSTTEQESFSDSYSHLSPPSEDCPAPPPEDSPAPPLTTETLGHLDSGPAEERGQTGAQDETPLPSERQELHEEESKEETEAAQWSPLETPPDPAQTETLTAQEAEPEVRRRRRSLLEKIGRQDEEEEAEEDFQVPQRDEDSGITLNKCILGAVILLGLGTIFISGVFMDLDEENDYPSGELKDSEAPGKQEWLNPDVARAAAEADPTDVLNQLNKGSEQIAMLKSQLQSQNEEANVANAQPAGGSTEQLQAEEVEKEHSRLKRDSESVRVLQRELETMRTELQSVSVLKKEVETLRSTLTQLKLSAAATTPSSGRTEDNTQRPADQQVHRKDKHDRGVREEWKEKSEWKKEMKQRKDGGKMENKDKAWKKDRFEGDKIDKKRKDDKYSKHGEDTKEWKKDKSKRGDEGKPWKEKGEKKEWTDRSDKKVKHDKFKEDKEWKSREERRDFKEGKHHGEKRKGPADKESKRGRDGYKEENRDKYERKHWKEREGHESRSRKDNGERREDRREWSENGKDQKKWKKKEDRRQWSEEDEWNGAEKKHQKERFEGKFEKHKGGNNREHAPSERKPAHSPPKPAVGQPEYWSRQRERLQHSSKPQQPCDSPDACAQAEGVRPVLYPEFDAILQNYLSKAQTAGVDASQIDELRKLAAELFLNGVFPHGQMSFQDYVEDVGDILEDLVEGEDDNGQNDSAIEDEMEGFEREVMLKFALSESAERGRVKGEWREESGRGRA